MPKTHRIDLRAPRAHFVTAVAIAMAVVLSTSFSAQAQTQGESIQQPKAGLTRAEVVADLALWRRAGLDQFEILAQSYSLDTQAFRDADREYRRLRSSEQFQIEVQKAQND